VKSHVRITSIISITSITCRMTGPVGACQGECLTFEVKAPALVKGGLESLVLLGRPFDWVGSGGIGGARERAPELPLQVFFSHSCVHRTHSLPFLGRPWRPLSYA